MTDDQTFFAGRRPAILAGDDLAVGAADAEPKRAHQDCAVGARRLWNVFKPHRTGNARRNCDCAHWALRGFGPQIEVQWRTGPRPLGQVALLQRKRRERVPGDGTVSSGAGTRWNPLVEPALPLRCGARRHILIFSSATEPHHGPYRAQTLGNCRGLYSFTEFFFRSHTNLARNRLHLERK